MYKFTLVILLAGLVVLSCSNTEDEPLTSAPNNNLTGSIMPLSVGNEWRFLQLEPVRPTLDDYIYDTSIVITSVISDTLIGDETWYRIQTVDSTDSAKVGPVSYRTNRDDGLWTAYHDQDSLRTSLFVKYPAEMGDHWEIPSAHEWAGQVADVIAVDEKMEVMGDTLLALQVMYRLKADSQLVAILSFVPDLGLVHSRVWSISIGLPGGGGLSTPDIIQILDSVYLAEM